MRNGNLVEVLSDHGLNLLVLEESGEDWEFLGDGVLGILGKSLVGFDVGLGGGLEGVEGWLLSGQVLSVDLTSFSDSLLDESLSLIIESVDLVLDDLVELGGLLVESWRLFLEGVQEIILALEVLVSLGDLLKNSLLFWGDGLKMLGDLGWDKGLVFSWDIVIVLWDLRDWSREGEGSDSGEDDSGTV